MTVFRWGRLDLAMCMLFGAMAGVFGRHESPARRLQQLCRGGHLMTASVVGGIAASMVALGLWAVVLISSTVAGIFSLVVDVLGLRPTGPFTWFVAFTATAVTPFLGHLAEGRVARSPVSPRPDTSCSQSAMAVRVVRYAFAVGAAGAVATASGLGHRHWAMLAATASLAAADVPRRATGPAALCQ